MSKTLKDELERLKRLEQEASGGREGLAFGVRDSYGKVLALAKFLESGLALSVVDQFVGSPPVTRTITLEDAARLRDFLNLWLPKESP